MAVNGSLTIGKYLEGQAHALASHEAVVYSTLGIRYSYQEFYELTEKVAKGLMALGVRKGDHIAVWATNVPEWILLQFGSARAGAVLVTVNTSYQQNELEYLLKQSDAKALFLIEGFKDTSYVQMAQTIQAKKKNSHFLKS